MNASLFAAFWAVSILFVITPGADWAYTISSGMRERAILPAIGGLLLGHLLATLIVAAGVGALIAGVPVAMTVLTFIGAAYLLWLGIGLVRDPPVPTTAGQQEDNSPARWAFKGFCVSGLNPKLFLLFLALLPQFVDPAGAWSLPVQMMALGGVHVLNCGVVYLMVGHGSRAALRARPKAARAVGRTSGAIMIALALILVAEKLAQGS